MRFTPPDGGCYAPLAMPTYVYETVKSDGSAGTRFEFSQSIKDPPLARHPETGEEIRRVVTLPTVLGTSLGANSAAAGPTGPACGPGCGCHG